MKNIFNVLEWLSKYGFIDLAFGFGIFGFIINALKRKTVSNIDSVDLVPYIDKANNTFTLMVKNQSSQILYLYKAYIKPGYYTETLDKSSIKSILRTLIFRSHVKDKFPKIFRQPKTSTGEYILQIENPEHNQAPTIVIQRYGHGNYILNLDPEALSHEENLNDLLESKQFGLLKLEFVHGTNSGTLEVQL